MINRDFGVLCTGSRRRDSKPMKIGTHGNTTYGITSVAHYNYDEEKIICMGYVINADKMLRQRKRKNKKKIIICNKTNGKSLINIF